MFIDIFITFTATIKKIGDQVVSESPPPDDIPEKVPQMTHVEKAEKSAADKKSADAGEGGRRRGRPGRKPITEQLAEDESALYYVIRNGRASLAVS